MDEVFDANEENNDQEQDEQDVVAEGWTCSACGHEGNTGKFCTECGAKQPNENGWTCPACNAKGNKGKFCTECGAKQPVNGETAPLQKKTAEATYAKCDFVAGDEIFFEDDLSNEQMGEFPSQWDLMDGNAEVAMMNGKKAIFMEVEGTRIEPLMKNQKNYLPDVFTIEFDFFIGEYPELDEDISSSWYFINFMNENEGAVNTYNDECGNLEIKNYIVYWWIQKATEGEVRGELSLKNLIKINDWNHLAISFNKRAFKAYINGTRIANIPSMSAPKSFNIWSGVWWGGNVYKGNYISNIRIAKGAVPLYDRMMNDGKIISYGITFDVGKSTIKPESMGEINRIVKLMTENPDLKFSVEGHTDNTGNAASNQTLSEARSKAIVDKLVELGIAANRLSASGKGQTNPIADNSTDEGRAKNRRVEFVKR